MSQHIGPGKTTFISNFFKSILTTQYDSIFANSHYFWRHPQNKNLIKH
jgi:hypothetical protein